MTFLQNIPLGYERHFLLFIQFIVNNKYYETFIVIQLEYDITLISRTIYSFFSKPLL